MLEEQVRNPLLRQVVALARRHDTNPRHAIQVARLALQIFDELGADHSLGPQEKGILAVAAFLHDIGSSFGAGVGHHKISRKVILSTEFHGLNGRVKELCGLVARYHRKAEPSAKKHKPFGRLNSKDRRIVEWLSGILRVADGLDRGHLDRVRSVRCEAGGRRVLFLLDAPKDAEAEILGAKQKSRLLEKRLGRKIAFATG